MLESLPYLSVLAGALGLGGLAAKDILAGHLGKSTSKTPTTQKERYTAFLKSLTNPEGPADHLDEDRPLTLRECNRLVNEAISRNLVGKGGFMEREVDNRITTMESRVTRVLREHDTELAKLTNALKQPGSFFGVPSYPDGSFPFRMKNAPVPMPSLPPQNMWANSVTALNPHYVYVVAQNDVKTGEVGKFLINGQGQVNIDAPMHDRSKPKPGEDEKSPFADLKRVVEGLQGRLTEAENDIVVLEDEADEAAEQMAETTPKNAYNEVASAVPVTELANVEDIPALAGEGFTVTEIPEEEVWSGDTAPVSSVHLLRKDGPYLTVKEHGMMDGKKVARVRTIFDPKGKVQRAFISERIRTRNKGGTLEPGYALHLMDA